MALFLSEVVTTHIRRFCTLTSSCFPRRNFVMGSHRADGARIFSKDWSAVRLLDRQLLGLPLLSWIQ